MENFYVLEINLISAQNLKLPSSSTNPAIYAVAWVRPSSSKKLLRTRVDRKGGPNPTWNDKFIFRVSSDFLSKDTSAVNIAIYSISFLKDHLIGTVRLLISNCIPSSSTSTQGYGGFRSPYFTALQIHQSSGTFHGILNVGVMLINGSDFSSALNCASALDYRHLMGRTPPPSPSNCSSTCLSNDWKEGQLSGEEKFLGSLVSPPCIYATPSVLEEELGNTGEEEEATANRGREISMKKSKQLSLCGMVFSHHRNANRKVYLSPSDRGPFKT